MRLAAIVLIGLLVAAAPAAKKPGAPVARAATPTAPPVPGDWNSYVRVSPIGTYIVGNPAAKVKIVEHLSYTCPHCAAFSVDSGPVLRGQMIKSGQVVIEYRPAVRDQIDLVATMLLRCIGPKRFAAASEALFAKQDDWLPIAYGFLQNDAGRYSLQPPLKQLKITAQLSGLSDFMQGQGMTAGEIDSCFTSLLLLRQSVAVGDAGRKIIDGTPTFFVDGKKQAAIEWSKLEPLLRAKGVQ